MAGTGLYLQPMNEGFSQSRKRQREIDQVSLELLRIHVILPGAGTAYWRPAVNAFRCRDRYIVCVDLAGMTKEAIKIVVAGRRLILRGNRAPLEPGADCPSLVALAMEIDHGPFERVLDLPLEVDASQVTAEYRQGVLWIELPLLSRP
jgi:HSP20 family protein